MFIIDDLGIATATLSLKGFFVTQIADLLFEEQCRF